MKSAVLSQCNCLVAEDLDQLVARVKRKGGHMD